MNFLGVPGEDGDEAYTGEPANKVPKTAGRRPKGNNETELCELADKVGLDAPDLHRVALLVADNSLGIIPPKDN